MIRIVCAVRDTAAQLYLQPFFVRHANEALRDFKGTVNAADRNNVISGHPSDFELWQLALFDDETGTFYINDENQQVRERIARAADLKETPNGN